ncbi:related to CHD1-transcriptional regulator [Rhynchosporium secalis]|uniref:Related to CHD1-transcriptional regulator n=1 Tax=Rhynchosporium secalis TaxID=38038 RepID=A0A1E1LY83_RHYSE|nr:related to CHD1-transcriptional regulator [Rhynchosporium secalis]
MADHISDPEKSESDRPHTLLEEQRVQEDLENSPPHSVLSHRPRESPKASELKRGNAVSVMVSPPARPWEYQPYQGDTTVETILKDTKGADGSSWYLIEFESGTKQRVPLETLLQLRNGQNALDLYNRESEDSQGDMRSSAEPEMTGKRVRTKTIKAGYVDTTRAALLSDDELSGDQAIVKKRRLEKGRVSLLTSNSTRQSSRANSRPPSRTIHDEESSNSDPDGAKSARVTRSANTRLSGNSKFNDFFQDGEDDDEDELAGPTQYDSDSDIVYMQPKRSQRNKNRQSTQQSKNGTAKGKGRGRPRRNRSSSSSPERPKPSRRSGRERATKDMRERDMDEEMYADDVAVSNTPKVISIREIYQPVAKDSPFGRFHNQTCDVCSGTGTHSNKGTSPLVYCQGCSTSVHRVCLGYRAQREHLVTKVGHENFVLQCRRCVGVVEKKDRSAPHLDLCQECKKSGPSCAAFAPKRTSKQEEKLREENDGDDPITEVSGNLINNPKHVLFRCTSCVRTYDYEHLPSLRSKRSKSNDVDVDVDETRDKRLKEYSLKWQCQECITMPAKVQALVAWRPSDRDSYQGQTVEELREDEKEYLIKWTDLSYFQCTWMSGAWVWGVTATTMRKAFIRRDEGINELPKYTFEDAIPEEFLRMEIIFDVEYDDEFEHESEEADKAAINMIDQVLVKFQGLGYEEAVWEEPPGPKDGARWSDFVAAYNEYVVGKYLKQPAAAIMKARADTFRSLNFEKEVELKDQPSALTGGKMMPYQMEGLNWLLYNFHQKKNVILADEMGLGKTIQLIAFMASLVKDNPECWPFLVVTPNSTCPNWRREIKKWAPDLRVVAYYGVKKARDMAMEYELYPDGCSDLRAHVVVTSYEAPVDDHSRSFFKKIKWAGMIIDEGQRLKNDENLLYVALKAVKAPFQVLLTGTPLQNNKRELFNLLQFLDNSINAAELDEKYAELTKENLPELHELIRPFFLRRTKLQVLKFLPPMAQVILPVSMSVVQKKLYRSILAKNPELIKSILGQTKTVLRPAERGNLNNILMQLRKCLCHPFLYSSAIEEISKTDSEEDVQRKLVEASSKFQLLKIMLPKLKERGHRVLLFSQFLMQLDLVEDFLNGLGLPFKRLDGNVGSLEKQKRIDAFNAPDSDLFAFLLSTRAGGVGINLATADTVIIMDPDFNPHQDIQALSRAHRIGQKKKVLVFQLMTKDSAEEKIVQIGRKKMALDQALIESMGAEDDAGVDLESILKHGAQALFEDDDRNDIRYDSASVDKLLDRTQVENTNTDEEKTAESQFSYARVWANDKGTLTDEVGDDNSDEAPPDLSVWDKILKQREMDAAAEAARNMQVFGRGKRNRQVIDYNKSNLDMHMDDDPSPMKKPLKRGPDDSASDLDFRSAADSDGDVDGEDESDARVDPGELESNSKGRTPTKGTGKKAAVLKKVTPVKNKIVTPASAQKANKAGNSIVLQHAKAGKQVKDSTPSKKKNPAPAMAGKQVNKSAAPKQKLPAPAAPVGKIAKQEAQTSKQKPVAKSVASDKAVKQQVQSSQPKPKPKPAAKAMASDDVMKQQAQSSNQKPVAKRVVSGEVVKPQARPAKQKPVAKFMAPGDGEDKKQQAQSSKQKLIAKSVASGEVVKQQAQSSKQKPSATPMASDEPVEQHNPSISASNSSTTEAVPANLMLKSQKTSPTQPPTQAKSMSSKAGPLPNSSCTVNNSNKESAAQTPKPNPETTQTPKPKIMLQLKVPQAMHQDPASADPAPPTPLNTKSKAKEMENTE